MTSKLKCPVCGKTELIRLFNPLTGEYFEDYDCPYRLCNFRGNKVAVDALTQAKQALKDILIVRCGLEDFEPKAVTMTRIAEKALEQIEHKE